MERSTQTEMFATIWTMLAVAWTIIWFVVRFTSLKDRLEYRLFTAEDELKKQELVVSMLTSKVTNADVTFMEIRTKLANIETMLMEMKNQIKSK